MTHNNNFNPLPWYPSLEYQNHRKSYAYDRVYPLYTPANYMLPWQIKTPLTGSPEFILFEVYYEDGTKYADVPSTTDLAYVTANDGLTVIFRPLLPIFSSQPDGRYYAKLTLTDDNADSVTYYSEVYTVVQSVDRYLKIEWYNIDDLPYAGGKILYKDTSYRNVIYLPTQLGKPEYTFEEEGENRDGYYYPEKQISEKTYRFTFIAPEYMCDALRLVRLSDYATITDQFGYEYHADRFLMTPKWLNDGDLASVVVEFQTDTVVKNVGIGYLKGDYADFNNDYNDDYDIKDNN